MRAPNFCFVFTPVGENAEVVIDQAVFFSPDDSASIRDDLQLQAADIIGECELEAVFELELVYGEGRGLHETSYVG